MLNKTSKSFKSGERVQQSEDRNSKKILSVKLLTPTLIKIVALLQIEMVTLLLSD